MKQTTYLISSFIFCTLCAISCKKNSDDGYTKTVSIQYKVTPSAGISQATSVVYMNESGALTTLTNQALPFSKTITRTVNKGDALTLRGDATGNGSLQLEILVNNTVVKSATPTGTSTITGQITYQFK